MAIAPWASGPAEILLHGIGLLRKDSDANRRLAMLSIDNAVELMLKTYLGLPKRVTNLSISRKEYAEFSESFPGLLDAAEKHITDKIVGIDLGEIEWYHRLRNQLYHQGNGLTVEIEKVSVYAELAKLLFKNLFGCELNPKGPPQDDLLGQFLSRWIELETVIRDLLPFVESPKTATPLGNIKALVNHGLIDRVTENELQTLRGIRNNVVHGASKAINELTPQVLSRIELLTRQLREKAEAPR